MGKGKRDKDTLELNGPSAMRVHLIGLLIECPYGLPSNDCPIEKVRHWRLEQRVEWAQGLSDKEVKSLYKYHKYCLNMRGRRRN